MRAMRVCPGLGLSPFWLLVPGPGLHASCLSARLFFDLMKDMPHGLPRISAPTPGPIRFFSPPTPSRTSFFTFHNFFFESLLLGLGRTHPTWVRFLFFFSFFLFCALFISIFGPVVARVHQVLCIMRQGGREGGRGKAHLGLWDSGRLVRCQSYRAKEKKGGNVRRS